MDNVIPGLYASTPEPLGFGPSLEIRDFLLQRQRGNLLVYRSEMLERDVGEINALGGILRQYLNHHHEASPACDWVAKTFDAPLHVHEKEAPSVSETCNVAETFSERHRLDDDFEVIPTPGHTPHHQSVLLSSGGEALFFPADLVPTSHHLPLPWIMGYDVEPLVTLESKRRMLRQAVEEGWILCFEHDPSVGWSRIGLEKGSYQLMRTPD